MARGVIMALAAAILFGASTPFAKLLLGKGIDPWLMAGLLYLGSGLGLGTVWVVRKHIGPDREASLKGADWGWLSLVILAGGVVGPICLMAGLAQTPASTAALLLNLEGVATIALAWTLFGESADRRLRYGASAILCGAVVLSWRGGPSPVGWGALLIVGACVAWGFDNNLTRKLSGSDPVQIATAKGLIAGIVNLTVALLNGASIPAGPLLFGALVVGLLGYGVSLVLFVLGLRYLGSARTGAYFSLAPFIGSILAIGLFGEPITMQLLLAACFMGVGLYLHLTERHAHWHKHQALAHEHGHVHDEHHQHVHGPDDPAGEPHSHRHYHPPMEHKHAHYPDLHHRHDHD
ncbi:MAG: EamA family transporter [Alphaproteobacteria bacterium]|nr:EamA family transporter [Alphaproteobacteria bacterium]